MNASQLVFAHVTKKFGDTIALNGVNLKIREGERVAFLGPNGSGKSTSVHLAAGLLKPTRGKIRVFGKPATDPGLRPRMGVMLQVAGAPPMLKVRELIELFRSYYPAPLTFGETVELAGLHGLEHRYYGQLSGGQQRRVQLALAICGNPRLLILDEPTVGIDVEYRRTFWERLRTFATGKTLLFTTHYLDEADVWADRIIVLHKGSVVADGPVADVKARVRGKRIRFRSVLPPERIAHLPGVVQHQRAGDHVELVAYEPERVVRELMALDRDVTNLEVRSAPLEDVFLELIDSAEHNRSNGRLSARSAN